MKNDDKHEIKILKKIFRNEFWNKFELYEKPLDIPKVEYHFNWNEIEDRYYL